MKKLIVFIIIIVCGCYSKKNGQIVPYKPSVILGKNMHATSRYGQGYFFDFYFEKNVYVVPVSKEVYDAYEVGDTLHEYQVIPSF